jgi:hypothetical protein
MRTTPHPIRVVWKTAQITMIAAAVLVVFLGLMSGGRDDNGAGVLVPPAAAACVAALVVMLTERKAAKIPPALRMWTGSATQFIARPPDHVWAFIRPAETAPAIQPEVRRAFKVPGTPDGPGEQQCFVAEGPLDMLAAGVVEVIEEAPGHLARVRSVTGPPQSQRYEVSATAGGSLLTYTVELSAVRWAPYTVHPRGQAAEAAAKYVASVKRLMESQPWSEG